MCIFGLCFKEYIQTYIFERIYTHLVNFFLREYIHTLYKENSLSLKKIVCLSLLD